MRAAEQVQLAPLRHLFRLVGYVDRLMHLAVTAHPCLRCIVNLALANACSIQGSYALTSMEPFSGEYPWGKALLLVLLIA
jgi:hypothetical protein